MQTDGIAQDSQECLLFSWETLLKKTKSVILLKVPQWSNFKR